MSGMPPLSQGVSLTERTITMNYSGISSRRNLSRIAVMSRTISLCVVAVSFTPGVWAQSVVAPAQYRGAVSGQISTTPEQRMQRLGTAVALLSPSYFGSERHQEPAASTAGSAAQELAKKLANPVAALVSVPFQNNFDFGIGNRKGTRWTLNVQPVAPFTLNKTTNLITRTIVPIIYQSNVFGEGSEQFGLGDTVASQFISPKQPKNGVTYGYGVAELIPTATDSKLGGKKWGLGPTAVALKQEGGVTYGALINHIWSIAGDSKRPDVSSTFINPFYSVTNKNSFTLSASLEETYDWESKRSTMPIIVGFSQVAKLNGIPTSFGVSAKWFAARTASAPRWGIRAVYTLLFPL